MNSDLLTVKNFSFSYDGKPILQDLSFSLKKGETMLLLGPSGSGKSSLALCLNGLYPASVDGIAEGSILLKGKNVQDYVPGEVSQQIGVVFQDPEAQFCMLTVEEEVAFGLENMKLPREEIAKRIKWALSLVGLEAYQSANIATLSGGLKQKLALACILAMKPDIVILDEPTALLDPVTTKEFAETMERLQKEQQFSLIVIEHKLDYWVSFLDRCFVLTETGHLLFDGTPKDAFRTHLADLKEQGIWLPKAFLLSEQLGLATQFPLTETELLEIIEEDPPLVIKRTVFSESILHVESLCFSRGDKAVLKNMNVNIPKGALTAVVGPNGAGKTTFSYALAGLIKPNDGEVVFNEQGIGYVFQNPEHQFITDSVFEEIAFSLRMQNVDDKKIQEKTEQILSACRLLDLADQHPFSLSQGQKRRLSVATMLVEEQSLLILDEPTYGQDAKATDELMKMIGERLEKGHSALMITHDMELVYQHAHFIIVIVAGQIRFAGTPHELFTGPSERLEIASLQLPLTYRIREKTRGDMLALTLT